MGERVVDASMSTGHVPTDDRANGPVRSEGDTPSLVAELVLRELLEAETALTEPDLRDRTLLPGAEVREALSELASRGLCTVRRRRTDHEPRRYVATLPTDPGV